MSLALLLLLCFSCVLFFLAALPWGPVAPYQGRLLAAGLFCLAVVKLLEYTGAHR